MDSAGRRNGRGFFSGSGFDQILDSAFDRLLEKKAELSIKRIRQLEELLAGFERELDEFIKREDRHG